MAMLSAATWPFWQRRLKRHADWISLDDNSLVI
jgi:hypothetical protein